MPDAAPRLPSPLPSKLLDDAPGGYRRGLAADAAQTGTHPIRLATIVNLAEVVANLSEE